MKLKNILFLVVSALLLIVLVYGLLYELYVVHNALLIFLCAALIISDLVVFIRLFWTLTTDRGSDSR